MLQRGEWEGKQLVPADWVDAATSKQVPNDNQDNPDWQRGYGLQFWRARHGAYRADGAFGQYVLVFPDQDATLAITSASPDMQATLDLVWEHLLPAFEGGTGDGTPRLQRLEILPPKGAVPTGNGRTYTFEPNQSMLAAVRLDADGTGTFTYSHAAGLWGNPSEASQEVVCTPGDWRELTDELTDPPSRMVTSAYADGDAFVATFRYLESPFAVTMTCRIDGDTMTIDGLNNVGFGPAEFTLRSQ
jgi:hypothetical protein